MTNYYHFSFLNGSFSSKNLLVPVKEFLEARPNDMKIIRENILEIDDSNDYLIEVPLIFDNNGWYKIGNRPIDIIHNNLYNYADKIWNPIDYFCDGDNYIPYHLSEIELLDFADEKDTIWWTKEVIDLNINYIYDEKDTTNDINIVNTFYFNSEIKKN